MAIISTYKVECGIAYYTGYIKSELSNHFQVTVLPLEREFFSSARGPLSEQADKIIKDFAGRLGGFDVVVLQLEYGIFGPTPSKSWKRIKQIIQNAPKVIIVFHTFIYNKVSLLGSTKIPSRIGYYLHNALYANIQNKIFSLLNKKKNCSAVIVQTRREELFIKLKYRPDRLYCHPLSYLSEERIREIKKTDYRKTTAARYGLNDTDVIIGFFGFISQYKGLETAIRAVMSLPEKYKLIIFGSTHPNSIKEDQKIDPYLNELIELIETEETSFRKKLKRVEIKESSLEIKEDPLSTREKSRVIFAGSQKNNDFEIAFEGCDYIVLPYLEVGQTSSGPASISVQLEKRLLLSNTKCYREFGKFAENCFLTFDIGNYIELAQKVESFSGAETKEAMITYNSNYNLATRAQCYVDAYDSMV